MTPFTSARPTLSSTLCLILLSFACLLSAPSLEAAVFVDKDAPGPTHNGRSWATAFQTIQAGVDAALGGGEVWVAAAGTPYAEHVQIGGSVSLYGGFAGTETTRSQRDWKANPTVVDGGGQTTLQTMNYGLLNQSYVVDGFTFTKGGIVISYGSSVIAHCAIRYADLGIYLFNGSTTVSDCTISGNKHGIKTQADVKVKNCTITGNGGRGIDSLDSLTGTLQVTNCLIAFNGVGVAASDGPLSEVFSHNNVYRNTTDYLFFTDKTGQDGNISADPKLSGIYHDIHIQPGSPCIDAGDDAVVASGAKDIDNQARIQGAHVDIGADESDGTVWPSPSRTWYVSPSGSNDNGGSSWENALLTPNAAALKAHGGDEVWIAAGVYRDTLVLPPGVALYGGFAGTETERDQRDWRRNVTVLDGTGFFSAQGVIAAWMHGVVVDGLTIRNGGTGVYMRYEGAASVANCRFVGNTTGLLVIGGTVTVRNCTFQSNNTGLRIFDATVTVTDTALSGNGEGIRIGGATASVVNCTVTGNTGTGITVESSTATVTNNLVAFNGSGISVASLDPPSVTTLSHNDVYGNTPNYAGINDPTGQDGNISVDPKLSNRYHDVHIQPDSPCIDAGDDGLVAAGATDIDGQPRIQGQAVDIGADESNGTTWPTGTRIGYVSPSGDDASDGASWGTAKRTIGEALDAVPGFDEVWVAGETYREALILPAGLALYGGFSGTETDRWQRQGIGHASILDGTDNKGTILVRSEFADARLDGFTLRNSVYGFWGGNGTAISNCSIHAMTRDAVTILGGSVEVANCTISGNADCGVRSGSDAQCVIRNSIIAFNRVGISVPAEGVLDLSHNNVYGNTVANYQVIPDQTGKNGNISADPLLVNPSYDSHIQPGSPCIDAGDDAAVPPGATDMDGDPRIIGSQVDIGADESDGTTWPERTRAIRVATTGNDANDGSSWALAMKTVGAALAAARGGDEIWVAKGLYTGNLSVGPGVALYGGFAGTETARDQRNWGVNRTGLDGGQNGKDTVTVVGHGITLDGLTVRGGRYGVAILYGTARIAHSTLTSNTEGVHQEGFGVAAIENCIVNANASHGISVWTFAAITNCTIIDNGGTGLLMGPTVSVTNCIIAFNSVYGVNLAMGRSAITLSHNNAFGNTLGNYWILLDQTGKDGNISADPLFVSRANSDFRLSAGSPCIDAGDDAAFSAGETDRDGRPRKLGASVDIGAHEYGAAYYTMADALQALRIAGGLEAAPADISRLDVEADSAGLDGRDAARLIRKATGLDANP